MRLKTLASSISLPLSLSHFSLMFMLEDRWEISLLNKGYIFYVLKHKEGISALLFMGVKQLLGSALKNVKKIDKKQAIKKLAFLPPWQTHCGHCCIYMWSVSGCGLRVSTESTDPATTKYFNHNTKSAIYRG